MSYGITSSDPEVVARWMLEMVRKMVTQNASYGAWMIEPVYPSMVWDDKTQKYIPDWPVSGLDNLWEISQDQMAEIATAMKTILSHHTIGYTRFGPIKRGNVTSQGLMETNVSEARWCDYRDHPYKGGREGTIMLGQVTKMANGNMAQTGQDVREICPECAAELGLNPDYVAPEAPADRKALLAQVAGKHDRK